MCAASASFASASIVRAQLTESGSGRTHSVEGTTIKRFVGPDKLIAILDWVIFDYQFDRHPIDHILD